MGCCCVRVVGLNVTRMATTTSAKAARKAAREAITQANAELARRTKLNVDDLTTFLAAMGRAETVDEWVAEKMARGEIRMGNPMRAVQHFAGLCQSGLYQFAVLGLPEGRDLDRLAAEVDDAVDTFYRAWKPDA